MVFRSILCAGLAVSALALATGAVAAEVKDEYQDFERMEYVPFQPSDAAGAPVEATVFGSPSAGVVGAQLVKSFQGVSQYDVASVARNFIPPDTMGAVGTTQYMSFANGGVAINDKATGARTSFVSDVDFWAAAGRTGVNGDSRVMFNKAENRWIAIAFGNSVSDIQIAVSKTADASGPWKSTIFTGFTGGTADYPTLAMDGNAVYIGTNNFSGSGNFAGTRLNVIPLASLFGAASPTIAGRTVITTPYNATTGGADGGFAIQGVNSHSGSTTGHVIAASLFYDDVIRYDVTNAGTATAAKTPTVYIGTADYAPNNPGRQPNTVADLPTVGSEFTSNDRVIDTLDQRISSSVYEVNGRIYAVYTVTPIGSDFTYVRYDVVDAATNQILDEGVIGDGKHDYYQGSLAVNDFGQVVIGYNRSGSDPADGRVSVLAQMFSTGVDGQLSARGNELLLKVSAVDDYHNGSTDGFVAAGRQRWGDYSAVSLDPTDERSFWVSGEYAREYNDAAGGHPGGTGGSRWSEWVSQLSIGTTVPEPGTWAMMLVGFGFIGAVSRRRSAGYTTA